MSSVTGLPVFFTPLRANISAITQSNPCVITTDSAHEYGTGMQVRIVLPEPSMGMSILNGNLYYITVIDSTSFSIPENTVNQDSFNSVSNQVAQVIPVGEVASTLNFAVRNGLTPFS